MSVQTSTAYVAARNAGQSFAEIFLNGAMEFRTGDQPLTADNAATGSLVARCTRDGGAWTAGNPANGLQFVSEGRYAAKDPAHFWRLFGLGTGTIGWFRLIANAADDNLDNLLAPRIDGACGLIDGVGDIQFFLPTLGIVPSTSIDINQWWFATPPI